ncbi:recombination regulator RecX [Staphylococcus intermedius]|uniref:Regulatory protein RecX n=1 Tax=Staphylococcus intermedius NCTC 11048 TaxID=1141106 RepID=A0A380G7L6_STAIN|nr:recombination regulator RecX [Staphylococcus intermedius]PCF63242.1 recombination regulator RecX [Staphylococcus intermedius]PCF78134.1 recombination regulator RecX [Staphylococcus intermedius]PCF79219.1 recombination regulator RecX [Staphylococcus intermedius]PCF85518.1 recombination regulator RecX [Staphylococcus intermedius]PCF86584.1 recombination regulator RecX [Staphylococcus intermedius]
MSKITKIEVQKNHHERFNIYIDNEFALGISMDTLVAFNIKKGDEVDTAELKALAQREHQQQANNHAIQYLSYRKRTRKEIATQLKKEGYEEDIIHETIAYCERLKLIDHRDYMLSLKNTMLRTTDKGPEVFRQKLHQAGIEADLIDEGVRLYEDEQSFERIMQIAQKIMDQKKGPVSKVKVKVQQSLQQKGFNLDTIFKVMNALDFTQDPETVDNLLQRDLEKVYNKYQKKYEGKTLYNKTIEALLRKGYSYDDIQRKLTESGIDHD